LLLLLLLVVVVTLLLLLLNATACCASFVLRWRVPSTDDDVVDDACSLSNVVGDVVISRSKTFSDRHHDERTTNDQRTTKSKLTG
jgi:hypothetical protein